LFTGLFLFFLPGVESANAQGFLDFFKKNDAPVTQQGGEGSQPLFLNPRKGMSATKNKAAPSPYTGYSPYQSAVNNKNVTKEDKLEELAAYKEARHEKLQKQAQKYTQMVESSLKERRAEIAKNYEKELANIEDQKKIYENAIMKYDKKAVEQLEMKRRAERYSGGSSEGSVKEKRKVNDPIRIRKNTR
jgi:hypothetical protein